ncbi:MAG: hypothetical protein ACRDTT_08710 [Pseudonocardiaceae bacterium]
MTETASPEQADAVLAPTRPRRHRRPVTGIAVIFAIGVVVVSALAAFSASSDQKPLYAAQTDIVFEPGPDLSDTAADRALNTQEVVPRSEAVLGPVSRAMQIPIKEIDEALAIEVVGQSNVVRLTVASLNPATAQTLTQMIADEHRKRITAMSPGYELLVLTPAHVLSDPLRPRPLQAAALGALVGVFIAAGMISVLLRPWVPHDDRSGIDDHP